MTTTDDIIKGLQSVEPGDNWIDQELLTKTIAEIERLGDDLTNAYRLVRERHDIIGYERALADEGADVLSRMVVGWKDLTGIDLAEHPDVVAFFAHYRAARG